jgi:aminoglycoside phosphotransferase (APT) family kinase protein
MTRLAGKPLAHEIERIVVGGSLIAQVRGLLRVPAIIRDITDAWVDAQIRLHALDPAPLLAAVAAGGLDSTGVTFDGQLTRLASTVEQFSFDGLKPALGWLLVHQPSASLRPAVCHGDFHPLNILGENGKVTGVIDWVNVVVAPAEMDVGSAIANIATVPFQVPPALSLALRFIIARILRRYQKTYAARRTLDGDVVRYFQVFRCMTQLEAVLRSRATGGGYAGAFDSADGIERLIRHIRAISGVTVAAMR